MHQTQSDAYMQSVMHQHKEVLNQPDTSNSPSA